MIETENVDAGIAFNKISSKKNTSSEKGDETDKQQVSINLQLYDVQSDGQRPVIVSEKETPLVSTVKSPEENTNSI